jgi:hypothetical protein
MLPSIKLGSLFPREEIMVLEVSDVLEFIPEWNENKKCSSPIVVKHKNPTMSMYERLIPKPKLKVRIAADGKSEGAESDVVIDNTKIIKEMVTGISNLDIDNKSNGKTYSIRTAEELFGDGPVVLSGLVSEIGSYLQNVLSKKAENEGKN